MPQDLIELARECGGDDCFGNDIPGHATALIMEESVLCAFASRIREQERERCAKECEALESAHQLAYSGKWPELRPDSEQGISECVARIRSLGGE